MQKMVTDFPMYATGPGTRSTFDDTFRYGIRVLRQSERPDMADPIRAQIDWEDLASRRNYSGDAAWSVDRVVALYSNVPAVEGRNPQIIR